MNNETLRLARTNLYLRMAARMIKALSPLIGSKPDPKAVAKLTKPFVVVTRKQAQDLAYRDYLAFIQHKNPVPKMELNRFTDELWNGSVDKATKDMETFGADQVEELAMKADYWARDAEWGQRVDVAKKDSRIDKVARVDFKPPTCPFCTLLNSRGAKYLSMDTAARTLHEGDTCSLIWVAKGQTDYPGHETSAEAKRRYDQAVKSLGSAANTTTILKALAEQDPDRPTGSVKANVQKSVKAATQGQIDTVTARISKLEKIQPKSDSARKYRDDQLVKNQDLLKSLEGTSKP
jgi:hypothetical protein